MNRFGTLIILVFLTSHISLAQPDPATVELRARKLVNSQGCKACHALEGTGATLAPELSEVAGRLSDAQLRLSLVNPQRRHGDGRIADFSHLQTTEIDALVRFLASFARD